MKRTKMPRDPNQRAKMTLDLMTGEIELPEDDKDPAAVERGHKGGIIGGARRAEKLSPERRAEIARKAAETRWRKS